MCDQVTEIIRRACEEPFFGAALIGRIANRIRERLETDPQPSFTFELACEEAARSSSPINIRVVLLRQDWAHLLSTLEIGHSGAWDRETLFYRGELFDVCPNAADKVVLVVFW